MGHLVGFPVTLGGFKVDGEGKDGLFRYSHQIGAFLFGLLAAGVQLPAVEVIGKGGDHFNELVDQFGSKTGTVHIDLLREKIVDRFHVRGNRLRFGRRGEGFQLLLQAGDLVISLFAKSLVFLSWQFAVCTHSSVVQLALFDFFNLALNRSSRHLCSSFSVLAAFDHLTGSKDGFVLIAPDLFKNLFIHYTVFLWYNGNIKTEEVCWMNATFDYGVSNYTEKALVETLNDLVQHVENEVVEFKLASNNFDLHKLGQYFSAISNEANLRNKKYGWLIFGVDDTTHEFRGTNYKNNPVSLEKLKLEIAKETTGAISFMDIFVVHPLSSE